MPFLGRDSFVGFGEETVWGTAVARTLWFRLVSENLRRSVTKVSRGVLAEAGASGNIRSHYRSQDKVAGDIVLLAGYEGQGVLWKHALWGTPTTSAPVGGIYTHTFKLGTAPPTGGLTVEVIRGTATTAALYEGMRITKMSWEVEAGGLVRITLSVLGQTSTLPAAGTATITTNELDVIHSQVGVVVWNAQNYAARMVRVEIDNKLVERQLLGDLTMKEPKQGDFRDVRVSMDAELENDNLQVGYTADTEANLTCAITGVSSRTMALTLHKAYIDDNSAPLSQVGVIAENTVFRGQSDGTDEGFQIVIANTQATALAA